MPAVGVGGELELGVLPRSVGVRAKGDVDRVGGDAVVPVEVGETSGDRAVLSGLLVVVEGGDRGTAIGESVIVAASVVGASLLSGSLAWILQAATIRNALATAASARMGLQLNRSFDWGIRRLPAVGLLLTVPSPI
jgi:hypothetical protein